jgi:hypothetical protein
VVLRAWFAAAGLAFLDGFSTIVGNMSVQEIKSQFDHLSTDERDQLESCLKTMRLAESPGFRARVDAAHRRMDAGEQVTSAQLRAMLKAETPTSG